MMNLLRNLRLPVLCAAVALLCGCGGGGGGGGAKTVATGIVRNSAAGDIEVGGATVVIGGVSDVTATVDNASATRPVGTFRIENPTVGAKTAVVTLPGQAPQTIGFRPAIAAGTNADITLYVNIGQVAGRVLGTDGKPVAGAFVVVNTALGSATATTSADGTFLLENIVEGDAEVTASQGPANVSRTVVVGKGLLDVGDLTLVEDDNPNPPGSADTIVGKVTNATGGAAIPGASVILRRNGVQVETTTTDAEGKFGFLRPVGTYSIQVIAAGFVDGDSGVFSLTSANTPPNVPLRVDVALTSR